MHDSAYREAQGKRAGIYRRVSTDKQEQHGSSLEDQERVGLELAERDGSEVVEIYTDVLSGADPDRPAYTRLLDDAIAGRLDVIYISALDRFGRDVLQITMALKTLDAAGVTVVPARGSIDRATPEGQMMTTIEAAFAEFERAKIKIRTKAGIAAKLRKGVPHGVPRFGYEAGEEGHWIVRPDEAELARTIFRLRVEDGLSYNAIARRLNTQAAKTRYGRRWSHTQVRHIIESRHTQGDFWQADAWHKGRHEPIVGEALWLAAQNMIGRDARFNPSKPGRRPRRHLFINGHLRCSLCGQPTHSISGPTPDSDSYVCSVRRTQGPEGCPSAWHRRADVDARFLAIFEREFLDCDATRERVASELDLSLDTVAAQLSTAETELARIEHQQQRVEADYLAAELGAAAYERLAAKLSDDLLAAGAERDRLAEHAETVRHSRRTIDAEEEALRRLAALHDTVSAHARDRLAQQDLEALRGIVATALNSVAITPDGLFVGLEPGAPMYLSTMGRRLTEGEPRYEIPLQARETIGNDGSRTL